MDFVKSKPKKQKIKGKNKWLSFLSLLLVLIIIIPIVVILVYLNWPYLGRKNSILVGDNTFAVVSLEQEKKTATLVIIPPEAYLAVTQGKGNIKAGSLFKFDQLQKQKGKLLQSTVREFLGIPIDNWFKIKGDINRYSLKQIPFWPLSSAYLRFHLSQIRQDKIEVIELGNSPVFQETLLPDGSQVLTPDPIILDAYFADKFSEWKILEENFSIGVLNSTEKTGLAAKAARIISHIGGKVILVGDTPLRTVNCILETAPDKQKSYTVKKLQKIFSCELSDPKTEENRADVIIIIGTAYQKEVFGS